jgi:hypothetical protein
MPFHIFLSQSLSLVTGGLNAWKIAKDIILFLLVGVALFLAWRQRVRDAVFWRVVLVGVVYGLIHLLVWALNPRIYQETAFEGIVYNNRLLYFAILGMGAVYTNREWITERRLIKLTLIISTIVCVFGVAQYFLPKDMLTHVGYSIERGVKPAFFIDDKPDFPRIMSTLRDPNSLGAFLLVPLCMLYGLFMKFKAEAAKRNKIIGLTLLHLVALLLTFSRGAWGGAFVAMVACVFFVGREKFRLTKRVLVIVAGIAVLLGGSLYMLRDQRTVQNIIQHSDETTVAAKDSNALHLDFVAQALKDIADKPQGHGPGTAGIVSIRNPNGGQLTENYYVQLLYEVGVVGFAVFAYAVVYVMRKLKGTTSLLGASLFAAAIAYACMGMLMHIWSNETVAAQWWLLAGAAIGLGVPVRNTGRQRVHK